MMPDRQRHRISQKSGLFPVLRGLRFLAFERRLAVFFLAKVWFRPERFSHLLFPCRACE